MDLSKLVMPSWLKSEFKPTQSDVDYYEIFDKHGMVSGRMVGGSKTGYMTMRPNNVVVFNANVITEKSGKVWFGDLDITRESDELKAIADELGEDLYILSEHSARFDNENLSFKEYKKAAVTVITTTKL
jgi:galactokinase/mevalonate kinase-like predicted kinase